MTTCPSGVNYMHLIDHGRKHIEKTYKRPFSERIVRDFLSKVLPNPTFFRFINFLTLLIKPFQYIFPKKIRTMISLMPITLPKKKLSKMNLYSIPKKKKPIQHSSRIIRRNKEIRSKYQNKTV